MASTYGDVTRIQTTGASAVTAGQDNLSMQGVQASNQLAETDLSRMNGYKGLITRVGRAQRMDPAVIAAIISRESRAGAPGILQDGWGDHGNAFGLMQVDRRHHTPEGRWDSEQHLTQATGILIHFIGKIQNKYPSWTKEQQFKGGIAAYNMGDGSVHSLEVDSQTTGRDYANDVVARAQYYKGMGFKERRYSFES
ncbi:hypothetical protein AAFF_G00058870 [Aldrovandia affinis]|uniref:Lysozyme g n=1 Tax=Aldrovandia affinis TaxID=143900 RepID=A0AAD7S0F4_9TELE|nr:hypothetical protein AAFF_G00058870 [Aldrovandia affinis]